MEFTATILITFVFTFLSRYCLADPAALRDDVGNIPNIWSFGQKMELYVYANKESIQTVFEDEEMIAHFSSLVFGQEIRPLVIEASLKIDPENGPLYLHLHLTKAGHHPDPMISRFEPLNVIYRRFPLFRAMKRPEKKVNLLAQEASSVDGSEADDKKKDKTVSYLYPDFTINLVNIDSELPVDKFPPFIRRRIYYDRVHNHYYPIVYFNEFWELKGRRILLDPEDKNIVKEAPIKISFSTTSFFKFQLMEQFDFAIKQQESIYGENNEFESIKRMFLETAPWLIFVTFSVSLLHSVFDFLAFKNDVQFWRKKQDLKGLSVRGVLINSVFQFIIFCYLLDNETSWIIIASVGIGALIEIWKISKVMQIRWNRCAKFPLLCYPTFHDRSSYIQSKTREYDQMAVKYLTTACIPVLIAYSIWSLKYKQHKSWYSWILNSLVGFVYTFGFITMTPQLFINYKLKSVAHMPWKVFTYKALNTFIDDLFAFVIKMPWLHRLACFRDDVLFFVYLYQMWVYPVDMKRANEFGQTFKEDGKDKASDEEEEKIDEQDDSATKQPTDSKSVKKRTIKTQ